jgi:hypothetical protein
MAVVSLFYNYVSYVLVSVVYNIWCMAFEVLGMSSILA